MADEVHGSQSDMVNGDKVLEAERLKEKANEYFKKEEYESAIKSYTKAIQLNDKVAAYYGNRSIANLRSEYFGSALADANTALELDKSYTKAYYRRASANMALGRFKLALKDFEMVTKVRPSDKDAKLKFSECAKIVNRIAFEKAIAVDTVQKSIVDSLDFGAMSIGGEYTGPELEDDNVTVKFLEDLMETYENQRKLHRRHAYRILVDIKKLFMSQPNVVEITVPENTKFTVCGDIHGQFYDLLNIFKLNGVPSEENPYLFNGDFVDRGSFSVECIFTLFAYKLLYPDHFFMSRGNHESSTMNQMYGFEGEVRSKYSQQMADLFTEIYNWLPLCHLINNRVLVTHGGLFAEDGVTIEDIQKVNRNGQPPESGIMCDLLWSDPQDMEGRTPSKRGIGVQFGPDVTKGFLNHNNLDYIIRSHEVKQIGYEVAHEGKCITVFSAPNYCDTMGNNGAFITFDDHTLKPKFTTYPAVPHPNVKPMAYANPVIRTLF